MTGIDKGARTEVSVNLTQISGPRLVEIAISTNRGPEIWVELMAGVALGVKVTVSYALVGHTTARE